MLSAFSRSMGTNGRESFSLRFICFFSLNDQKNCTGKTAKSSQAGKQKGKICSAFFKGKKKQRAAPKDTENKPKNGRFSTSVQRASLLLQIGMEWPWLAGVILFIQFISCNPAVKRLTIRLRAVLRGARNTNEGWHRKEPPNGGAVRENGRGYRGALRDGPICIQAAGTSGFPGVGTVCKKEEAVVASSAGSGLQAHFPE